MIFYSILAAGITSSNTMSTIPQGEAFQVSSSSISPNLVNKEYGVFSKGVLIHVLTENKEQQNHPILILWSLDPQKLEGNYSLPSIGALVDSLSFLVDYYPTRWNS